MTVSEYSRSISRSKYLISLLGLAIVLVGLGVWTRSRSDVPKPGTGVVSAVVEQLPLVTVVPGSVVNFALFLQKWPKIQHSSPKCLHQSLGFRKRSFSPSVVLLHESDGVSPAPGFG